jgi:hypothetical protein
MSRIVDRQSSIVDRPCPSSIVIMTLSADRRMTMDDGRSTMDNRWAPATKQ